jgi:hypothetical protein
VRGAGRFRGIHAVYVAFSTLVTKTLKIVTKTVTKGQKCTKW